MGDEKMMEDFDFNITVRVSKLIMPQLCVHYWLMKEAILKMN